MLVSMLKKTNHRCEWISLLFLTLCFFVSPISVTLTTITYLLAFAFLLLSGDWYARWSRIKNNKAALSFLLLAALFFIGIFYSTSIPHLILQDFQKRHWLLMTPFFIMILTEECWRKRMINTFLCAMIITLFISVLKFFFHLNLIAWIHFAGERNGARVFLDHIEQSFAMNIAAFICGYRFLFEKKLRLFYVVIFLLMAINIVFMSTGRTGYGIFFLLLMYLGLMRFGWRGILAAVIVGIAMIGIAYFASASFQSRMKSMAHHFEHYDQIQQKTSISQRVEMWNIATRMIDKKPYFGYGTGGIRTQLPLVVPAKDRVFNPSIDYVESIYLNFLLEFGAFGLGVLLIAIALQIKTTFQLPHAYRCLMQAVLIAVFFGGFFNAFFVSFPIAHMYALFSVLCFSSFYHGKMRKL